MPKNWTDTKPNVNQQKWEDLLEWYKFKSPKEEEFNQIRLIGPIMSAAYHWVEVVKTDGTKTAFPMTCAGYDPETETFNVDKCPACVAKLNASKFYFQNAIIRPLQENMPVNARTFKDFPEEIAKPYREVGDRVWSPIRVVKITSSCATQLRDIVKLNRHKIGSVIVSKDVSDTVYGIDVYIKFDPDESPANMYNVQKGDHTPLSEAEQSFKLFKLDIVSKYIDVIRQEKDLLRLGHLKPEQARFFPVLKNSDENNMSVEDDDSLPPPLEETPQIPMNDPKLTALDAKLAPLSEPQLKALIRKKSLKIPKIDLSTDALRIVIRNALLGRCVTFGDYQAIADCFTCSDRVKCIEESEHPA